MHTSKLGSILVRQMSHKAKTMKEEKKYWVLGHLVQPVQVSGNYDMVIGTTPPQVPGPPPHFHNGYNEMFMVLEGEMEFMINGEAIKLTEGQSVDLPPKALHTFRNAGSSPCKWINIHSPKGFLSFFKDVGVTDDQENAVQLSVADDVIQRVMQTAADYDMHIQLQEA